MHLRARAPGLSASARAARVSGLVARSPARPPRRHVVSGSAPPRGREARMPAAGAGRRPTASAPRASGPSRAAATRRPCVRDTRPALAPEAPDMCPPPVISSSSQRLVIIAASSRACGQSCHSAAGRGRAHAGAPTAGPTKGSARGRAAAAGPRAPQVQAAPGPGLRAAELVARAAVVASVVIASVGTCAGRHSADGAARRRRRLSHRRAPRRPTSTRQSSLRGPGLEENVGTCSQMGRLLSALGRPLRCRACCAAPLCRAPLARPR